MINTQIKKQLLLIDCIREYLGYLIDRPLHYPKLSSSHIKRTERHLNYMLEALQIKKINVSEIRFSEINDKMVGYIYEHVTHFSASSFNSFLSTLNSFSKYTIIQNDLEQRNPFRLLQKRRIKQNLTLISMEEFGNLLKMVTPENGNMKVSVKCKNLFRPWLTGAYWIGFLSGLRANDIVMLKWSDIYENENKEPFYIQLKRNKVSNRVYLHIFPELKSKLYDLGYEKNKGSNKFIFEPDKEAKREGVVCLLRTSFSHYYSLLNTGDVKYFRHLRRTFITKSI